MVALVFSSKENMCACLSACLCVNMKECVLIMGEDEENLFFSPDSKFWHYDKVG